jgi:hypothetical protein
MIDSPAPQPSDERLLKAGQAVPAPASFIPSKLNNKLLPGIGWLMLQAGSKGETGALSSLNLANNGIGEPYGYFKNPQDESQRPIRWLHIPNWVNKQPTGSTSSKQRAPCIVRRHQGYGGISAGGMSLDDIRAWQWECAQDHRVDGEEWRRSRVIRSRRWHCRRDGGGHPGQARARTTGVGRGRTPPLGHVPVLRSCELKSVPGAKYLPLVPRFHVPPHVSC